MEQIKRTRDEVCRRLRLEGAGRSDEGAHLRGALKVCIQSDYTRVSEEGRFIPGLSRERW